MAIYLQIAVFIGNGDQEENLKGRFHDIEVIGQSCCKCPKVLKTRPRGEVV
jgi:hypothetical protein